ncbi:MAG TPA: Fe-S-containing protein [Terriglobales bacterium]|nr:Fe-S-containing protein [Terriglobales bacterium]
MPQFIITLREGVEAALVIGIVLAYLAKVGRPELRRVVYAGLAAAFAGSIAVAIVISRMAYNQDVFEGWVMLGAAVFVISMVVFMARTARSLKGKIEDRVGGLTTSGSKFGLFGFVFLMVLREGVETVLVLSAISPSTSEFVSLLGTIAGVLAAVLFGVMFVKGSVRINLRKFFRVTTVILMFVAFQLVISGLHELSEDGVLPSSPREMALVGPVVRNDMFFFVTILALAGLMILFEQRRREPKPLAASSNAERRKAQWSARRERLWMGAVYSCSFIFILLVTAQFIYAKTANAAPPATPVTFSNGVATIPTADLADGDLHRYQAVENGVQVRFLLYRKPDGKVASVLDACQICGSQGFSRTANGLVCRNCAAPVNPQSVGQPGGCNPIPLKSTAQADAVVIAEGDLAAAAGHFGKH